MQAKKIVGGYLVETDQVLGTGAMGKVVKGMRMSNNEPVAVKIIDKLQFRDKNDNQKKAEYKSIQREIAIQKSLDHQNIIKLYEAQETNNNVYMFMELGDGTFDIYLKKQITQTLLIQFMYQIFDAFIYLTKVELTNPYQNDVPYKGICHLDLKPKNILMVDGIPKISDFGLSVQLNIQIPESTIESTDSRFFQTNRFYLCKGTLKYMSFQQLNGIPIDNLQLHDVWSAGVIFYELIYQKHPYFSTQLNNQELNHQQINPISVSRMIEENYPFKYGQTQYHPNIIELVRKMLTKDHTQRLTWEECLKFLSDNLLNIQL